MLIESYWAGALHPAPSARLTLLVLGVGHAAGAGDGQQGHLVTSQRLAQHLLADALGPEVARYISPLVTKNIR